MAITRRFFASILASAAAASATVTSSVRQAFGGHRHTQELVLAGSGSSVRMALWFRIQHEDRIRFKVGTLGQEPLASGMIAPLDNGQTCRDYQVLSICGLSSSTSITVSLSSKKPFKILGLQEVFDKPYEVRSNGEYAKVDTGGRA
jgi:hypothetical protein